MGRKIAGLAASKRGALGTSGRVPSFEAGTICYPSGMFRREGKRDAGNNKNGDGGLLDSTEAEESRRVPVALVWQGGRSVGPSGMIRREKQRRRSRYKSKPETRQATELAGERWRFEV